MDALFNWKRRALIAENRLRQLGENFGGMEPTDDFYIENTLQKKDGSPLHIDELNAARARMAAIRNGG